MQSYKFILSIVSVSCPQRWPGAVLRETIVKNGSAPCKYILILLIVTVFLVGFDILLGFLKFTALFSFLDYLLLFCHYG